MTTTEYDNYELTSDYSSEYVSDYSDIPIKCEAEDPQSFLNVFQPCILAVIFVLGMVGNILVLIIYTLYRRLKSMTDVFLLNLALADLLLLLTLPFLAADARHGWLFGGWLCKAVRSLYSVNYYSGFLFLTCISVDRYIAIVLATVAHKLRPKTIFYSKVSSALVWLVSVVMSVPEMVWSKVVKMDDLHCEMILDMEDKVVKAATQFAQVTVGFWLPFVVMLFCYSVITRTLLKGRGFQKHKALKVIGALVLLFVLFQLPYSVVLFLKTTDWLGSKQVNCGVWGLKHVAEGVTRSLAFLRCCLNPLLYGFVGVKFRNDVLLLFRDLRCMSRSQYSSPIRGLPSSSNRFSSVSNRTTESSSVFSL
ncbi:C-C chemokine receptor type 7-like [Acipenser oxyrinchus oxyrinchus]|uniref:C-C chemokine receptor type 7-like n=1 Tax=Acipenser oxyrinchus oxyrinchus TaxID=40147 RepID=A0AAD8FVQ8_ACIOX|nr:C-C chemokine receptor type 7-like [Acipenser oxyrinchus oxyrinchus]